MSTIFGTQSQGSTNFTGNVDMGGNTLTGLQSYPSFPVNNTDAATKGYVDAQIADIETGAIALNFTQPNYCVFGSNTIDPEHPTQYTGTQGFLTDSNIASNAAIGISKLATDPTNLSNDYISGTFTPTNTPIITSDSGYTIAAKAQGQINNLQSYFPITNTNISSTAAISMSKLATDPTNLINDYLPSSGFVPSNSSIIAGDNALVAFEKTQGQINNINSNFPITTSNIASGTIVNSNISSTAGISISKLATDPTNLINDYLPSSGFVPSNSSIIAGDNGLVAFEKTQGQINQLNVSTLTSNLIYLNNGSANIDVILNAAASGYNYYLAPGNYIWTLNAVITQGANAISVVGYAKSFLTSSNSVFIGGSGSLTLKTTNEQWYFLNLTLTLPGGFYINGNAGGASTTNAFSIEDSNVIGATYINCTGFCEFTSTSFTGTITINSSNTATLYFTNCAFNNSTITNSSSASIIFNNCSGLNTYSITGGIFEGINVLNAGTSQLFTTNEGFYNSITLSKYLFTTSDISSTAGIIGNQLANTTVTGSKIANNTITATQIANNTITATQIANNTITNTQLASTLNLPITQLSSSGASSNQVITYNGTAITWATPSGSSLLSSNNAWTGTQNWNTGTTNSIMYYNPGATSGVPQIYMSNTNNDCFKIVATGTTSSQTAWTYNTGWSGDSSTNDLVSLLRQSTRALSSLNINVPFTANFPATLASSTSLKISSYPSYYNFNGSVGYSSSGSPHLFADNFGNQFGLSYDGTTYQRLYYNVSSRWSDAYDSNLWYIQVGSSRANSIFTTNCSTNICTNIPGPINIGGGSNRSPTSGNNITIGGNGGTEYIAIGAYAGSSSGQIVIGSVNCGGMFQIINSGSFNFTNNAGSSTYLTPGSATLTISSSLSYKLNIINKTSTYITNASTPVKNYYQKILGLPIYTYTYKQFSIDPLTNPNGSYDSTNQSVDTKIYQSTSYEDWYSTFNHGIGNWSATLSNAIKPDISTVSGIKTLGHTELVHYLVLALQEQNKFVITPLQNTVNTQSTTITNLQTQLANLTSKYNSLISYLTTQSVIPANTYNI